MKTHPWFEQWRVGPEWASHDEAIWNTGRVTLSRGEYWFFLFNSLQDQHKKVHVLINKLGKRHWHNKQLIRYERVSDTEWRNNSTVWYYLGGEVRELFTGMAHSRLVPPNRIETEHPSGFRVAAWGSFPDYSLTIHRGDEEIGRFECHGTAPTEFVQAPNLQMRSLEGRSADRTVFAKLDRVSQPPYCATNCCDFFVPYKGRFMGEAFEGQVWVERARSFGLPPNWILLWLAFDDRSRLWMRKFTGKINHYDPLSFYFDDERARRRYAFDRIEFRYLTGYNVGPHASIRDDSEYVSMSGRGPDGEMRVLCELKGQYLHRYTSYKYESRYYQTVLDPVEFELRGADGRVADLNNWRRAVGYGEETYKKKWRETIMADLDDRPG